MKPKQNCLILKYTKCNQKHETHSQLQSPALICTRALLPSDVHCLHTYPAPYVIHSAASYPNKMNSITSQYPSPNTPHNINTQHTTP